ncbi:MAG: D-sedoheptulose-7-phosphate isomerase [Phycisphaerales bacterium]
MTEHPTPPHTDIRATIDRAADTLRALNAIAPAIADACAAIQTSLNNNATIYTCGNGGSAAQSMHLAEELIGRYKRDRRPLRAISLNADPTALTCIANDFGYDHIFERQLQALARPGDCLVAFTTSGKSPNILHALRAARAAGATTIAMLGKGGGPAVPLCDHPLIVPSDQTERIQEAHQLILHLILDAVEPHQ